MADPRPDAKTVTQNGQEAVRKAADEGVRVTRAGAEAMQRNAKTVEDAWRSGSDLAMRITEQSADQFSRIFGLSGEEAQRAAQTSSRNLHALLQSSTLLAETAQNISREWFEFARARLEHNLSQIEALLRARTPQDLAALQSELLRDNLEGWLQSTRRIAELSARMSDEAARKIGDTVEQARRAA